MGRTDAMTTEVDRAACIRNPAVLQDDRFAEMVITAHGRGRDMRNNTAVPQWIRGAWDADPALDLGMCSDIGCYRAKHCTHTDDLANRIVATLHK